jgi:tyrosine-protein kinase Etk/Wzc
MSNDTTKEVNNRQPPELEEQEINLLDLLLVLARRWKMIIGVPFVVAVITAVYSLTIPNIYTAKTMIIPTDNDSGGMGAALMAQLGGLAGLAGGAIGTKSTSALYVTMLKSETLKDPIIDKFKLMELYKSKLRSTVYSALDGATSVNLGKSDGVITIAVSDKDPKLAADLANEYVEQLGRLSAKLTMAGASSNRMFIEKRIAEAKADLSKAEEHLKEFQTKHKTISVPDQAKAIIEGVAQLRGQLAAKEVELGTLQRQFTDNSQEVKTAKSAVASIRAQIAGLEGKGGAISSSISNLGSVPQLGQEYLHLMRDFKIQEAVLEILTKQYEMAQINETKDTAPFQLLEKAKVPERKSKPKRSQIVILAAVTSGFLMVFLAFILQYLEQMPAEDKARLHQLKGCFVGIASRFKSRKTV